MRALMSFAAAATLVLPQLASAQQTISPAPDTPATTGGEDASVDPNIVVEGEKYPRKAIKAYIRSVVAEESAGQYAKFDAPVCPSFTGFNEELSAFLEERMRDVAEAADIPTGKANCRTNVHVSIV